MTTVSSPVSNDLLSAMNPASKTASGNVADAQNRFMTLLVTVLTLAGEIGISSGVIAIVGTFAPPIHIHKQLRGAYQLRRFSAFWRTCALVVFGFVALMLFLALLLALGLMG